MSPPLTPEQQDFASKHHGLIIAFMRRYSLDSNFYDLLALRYLKAVVRYTTDENLQRYAFSTVVWYHLRSELASYYKALERQAMAEQEFWVDKPPPAEPPLDQEIWEQIEKNLTYKQSEAIKLRDAGYSNREIASICGVQLKAIEKRFTRIRKKINKLKEY